MTRDHLSLILELIVILDCFKWVSVSQAVVCTVQDNISGLDSLSQAVVPWYMKLNWNSLQFFFFDSDVSADAVGVSYQFHLFLANPHAEYICCGAPLN